MSDHGASVRRVTRDALDLERVTAPIVVAFASDPFIRWFLPDPRRFLAYFPRVAALHATANADRGGVFERVDGRGAAIWYPPGTHPDAERLGALFGEAVSAERVDMIAAAFTAAAKLEPDEPHWYLRLIGVDPRLQGKGHGSALLKPALDEIDHSGESAYLEATSAPGRDFYMRHGFEVLGEVLVGDAPPMWPMLRRARH